jgi:hypothetical protein
VRLFSAAGRFARSGRRLHQPEPSLRHERSNPGARGTPPFRRDDSRAAGHGPHTKIGTSRTHQATKSATRKIAANQPGTRLAATTGQVRWTPAATTHDRHRALPNECALTELTNTKKTTPPVRSYQGVDPLLIFRLGQLATMGQDFACAGGAGSELRMDNQGRLHEPPDLGCGIDQTGVIRRLNLGMRSALHGRALNRAQKSVTGCELGQSKGRSSSQRKFSLCGAAKGFAEFMDSSAFFGVVATVDFALLGLWWVAVQTRPDLRGRPGRADRMSYLVSLQFVVPGTAALLAQVAPQLTTVWRVSFALAGLCGVLSIALLVPTLASRGELLVPKFLRLGALPLYAAIAVLAVIPGILQPGSSSLSSLQVEALLFCLMVFLGAQIAWAAAMSPEAGNGTAEEVTEAPVDKIT